MLLLPNGKVKSLGTGHKTSALHCMMPVQVVLPLPFWREGRGGTSAVSVARVRYYSTVLWNNLVISNLVIVFLPSSPELLSLHLCMPPSLRRPALLCACCNKPASPKGVVPSSSSSPQASLLLLLLSRSFSPSSLLISASFHFISFWPSHRRTSGIPDYCLITALLQ